MVYKRIFALLTLILVVGAMVLARNKMKNKFVEAEIKDGDLIFQTSLSSQSKAIQLATNSKYSHCGIIYKTGTATLVYEAAESTKLTLLSKWIAKGKDGKYIVKRLKNADQVLTKAGLEKLHIIENTFAAKPYDLAFSWSDEKIYCSELIWKVYQQATGIEIGKLQQLKNFDLSNPAVKAIMKQRYGSKVPLSERVISPKAIFESDKLMTIIAN